MASEFWDLFAEWGNDTAGVPLPLTVEPYKGFSSVGPVYLDPIERPGLPQLSQDKLVMTAQGNEATSSAAVYAPTELAGDFPLHSRVTLADGRQALVLSVAKPDVYGVFDFVVLNLE